MLRSPLVALLLATLLVLPCIAQPEPPIDCGSGDPPPDTSTIPKIDVRIERVDTARYPEVDLYFRVVDANATTAFIPLRRDYITLEEGTGSSLAPVRPENLVGDNFTGRDPDLRALASAVVLDRSASVEQVLPFIRQAIEFYISKMEIATKNTYRLDPNSPQRDDTTMAIGLAGQRAQRPDCKIKDYTEAKDKDALSDWVEQNFRDTACCSPIYPACEQGVLQTMLKSDYDLPDGSRVVYLISDGKNNRGYTPAAQYNLAPNRLIKTANAGRVRVYTLGMVFIDKNGVSDSNNICRRQMRAIAEQTGGTYFEPINPFPVVPGGLDSTGKDLTDPAALDDNVAKDYINSHISTLASLAKRQNLDTTSYPLPAEVKTLLTKVMEPLPDPYTYKEMIQGVPSASPTATAIPPWIGATYPTLVNLDQVTYGMLADVQDQLSKLAAADPSYANVDKGKYYNEQVANVLTKIQASEKRIYRLTYKVDNAPFDGTTRDIRLTVRYRSDVNGVPKDLIPGTDTINYKAPARLEEDPAAPLVTEYEPTTSAANNVVFGPKDPRNQDWLPSNKVRVNFLTRLLTEAPATTDGKPAVPFAVMELKGAGPARDLPVPSNLADRQDVTAHRAGEASDYNALITSLEPRAEFDEGSGKLEIRINPRIPTSVTNPVNPLLRPVANTAMPPRKHLQWYEISGTAERDYNYQALQLDGSLRNMVGTARVGLPTFTYYVADRTPPSLGIYLTPSGGDTGMVVIRSRDSDRDPTPETLLQGIPLGVPGNADTLETSFDSAPPYKLKGTGSTPGFMVPQNVQVRIQVLAKDNYDRNRNHAYLLNDPIPRPGSDTYTLDTINEASAKDMQPPYMPRVTWNEIPDASEPPRYNADGNCTSGVTWRLEEAGQATDTLTDTKIFRAANVSVNDDTFQVTPGQEIYLAVKASDAAGKRSFVRIPIVVTPMGVNIGKLTYESRRLR